MSDPWTGFTQFTLLEEKPPDGYMWSGERLTRKQLTSRPDHLWPELWKSMGKHAKLKEKQKWSNEKFHLENARKLRGIYFIDPEDTEFKETIKNARKKLETSVAPAMPCKIMKNCGSDGSNKIKTKLACILEADESTRMRMGNSIPHHHEDHIAEKGAEKSERPEQNRDLRCQSGPSAKDSVIFSGGDSSKNYGADQQRLQISDLHFDKFPTPATFACWKIRFKTEVCTCSQFPTEAMQWIKEVEMDDSVDELRSSSSTRGISMPNFEVLDARIASALKKSSIIPTSKEESAWRNKRPRSRTVSFAADRLLT